MAVHIRVFLKLVENVFPGKMTKHLVETLIYGASGLISHLSETENFQVTNLWRACDTYVTYRISGKVAFYPSHVLRLSKLLSECFLTKANLVLLIVTSLTSAHQASTCQQACARNKNHLYISKNKNKNK